MKFTTGIENNDLQEILDSKYVRWERLKDASVLVTGATGLIGSLLVKALIFANEKLKLNISIYALVRNEIKAQEMFGNAVSLIVQNIVEPIEIKEKIDYIIHTANPTESRSFVETPVETIRFIVRGTENVLEFARKSNTKSVVYLSSMEVLGKNDFGRKQPLKENDYGYMDLAEIRNSYPEGKRLAENLCVAYAAEYKVPVKVARLTQTIGAGINYCDNRVFTQFARNIYEKKDIVLHTKGETVRCYCYITDAITAILVLLINGENGKFYNVANEKTECSIKVMAEMLCRNYPSSKLIFDLKNDMNNYYLPPIKTVLDTSELRKTGWEPSVDIEEMFRRLICDFGMRNIK